jgi:hypothetical protein
LVLLLQRKIRVVTALCQQDFKRLTFYSRPKEL